MPGAPLPISAAQIQETKVKIAAHYDDIRAAEQEICGVEAQIAVLNAQISGIRDRISGIREDIAAKETFIAPFRRFPFDVLAEIIVFAATDPIADMRTLRTLSAVCRDWRDATLRTPRVWTNIVFYRDWNDTHAHQPKLSTLEELREWFQRSGSCPKDVHIVSDVDSDFDKDLDAVYDLITSHASELRSFSAILEDDGRGIERCISGRTLPVLEHVVLSSHIGDLSSAVLESLVASAPRLTSISARDLTTHYIPRSLRARLSGLTLERATFPTLLDVLRSPTDNFPVLRGLCIEAFEPVPTARWADTPAISTVLESLYFALQEQAPPALFRILCVPRLTRLAIAEGLTYAVRSTKKQTFTMLNTLITTSNPPLRELSLQRTAVGDGDLIKILSHLPQLEHLVLVECQTTDKFCDGLTASRGPRLGWLCPQLANLCIVAEIHAKEKNRVSRKAMERVCKVRSTKKDVRMLANVRLDEADLQVRWDGLRWEWTDDGREFIDMEIFASSDEGSDWWQMRAGRYL